ncbi:hypothetical protein KVR01_013325 [Diaporthe batatas]|uniref:uncharacterized protein n=1 Tax=Diaporthe batatas TaxID=748121 RepID=UPI001D05B171|nr:uncharacterized protein KVR01_013325 [Diaporthe batatas]KAG8156912.1 hypothetical protein KVR01_013325 [Diaporthe batatas]
MNISKIFLCLLGAASTAAGLGWDDKAERATCWNSGMEFSQMHDEHDQPGNIEDAIIDYCANALPMGDWDRGHVVAHCYPFPKDNSGNRVNLEVKNEAYTKQSLAVDECIYAMKYLYHECWCGGANDYNGFFFKIDPNAGKC